MTRAGVLISAALAVSVVASACGARPASRDEGGPTKPEAAIPDTARLICTENGSRLAGSKARPQPDGVHLIVENRLDSDPGFAVEGADFGLGDNAPPGESEHVLAAPPGVLRAGCYPADPNGEPDLVPLEVVDPEGLYVPFALTCRSAVTGTSGYAPGAEDAGSSPVELTREALGKDLKPEDRVEPAGYPRSRERVVRVVRDGEVIAADTYRRAAGGWVLGNTQACANLLD